MLRWFRNGECGDDSQDRIVRGEMAPAVASSFKAVGLPLTTGVENGHEVRWPNSMRYGFPVRIDLLAYWVALH